MPKPVDQKRLHQIELLLRWEGQVGNSRLREVLGLTLVRASQWLKEFKDSHSRWVQWNSRTRALDATSAFYREKGPDLEASLSQYLTLVGLPTAMDADDQVVVAAFENISTPNPQVFAALSAAARLRRAVEITYRSMREPVPHKRIISPHSIVHAGRRWHARAYSDQNKEFRDYALGRIVTAQVLDLPAGQVMEDDTAWMTEVPVRLIAHPDLTREQELLIRFEYFKDTAARVTSCRGPLVNYFIQDVRAAVDTKMQRPPDYQLAVENVKEIRKWLFPN